MARGCTGVAANYKNNTANQPPSPSSIEQSLDLSRGPLTLTSPTFCRFGAVKSSRPTSHFSPLLLSSLFLYLSFTLTLSLSLFYPHSFSLCLFLSSAFHPGFSRSRGCPDTSDYVWWLRTLNWEPRAYVLIFLQIARRPCFSFASVHLRKPAFLGNFPVHNCFPRFCVARYRTLIGIKTPCH